MNRVIAALAVCLLTVSPLWGQDDLRSPGTIPEQIVHWKNNTDGPLSFTWINFEGQETRPHATISQGTTLTGGTHPGHIFKVYLPGATGGYVFVVPDSQREQTIEIPSPQNQGLNAHGFDFDNQFYRGNFRSLNSIKKGLGLAWRHTYTRVSTGQTKTEYLAEITRTNKYIELRNPVTGNSYRLSNRMVEQKRGSSDWSNWTDGQLKYNEF